MRFFLNIIRVSCKDGWPGSRTPYIWIVELYPAEASTYWSCLSAQMEEE